MLSVGVLTDDATVDDVESLTVIDDKLAVDEVLTVVEARWDVEIVVAVGGVPNVGV